MGDRGADFNPFGGSQPPAASQTRGDAALSRSNAHPVSTLGASRLPSVPASLAGHPLAALAQRVAASTVAAASSVAGMAVGRGAPAVGPATFSATASNTTGAGATSDPLDALQQRSAGAPAAGTTPSRHPNPNFSVGSSGLPDSTAAASPRTGPSSSSSAAATAGGMPSTPVAAAIPSPASHPYPHSSKNVLGYDFPAVVYPFHPAPELEVAGDEALPTAVKGALPIFRDVEAYYKSALGVRVLGTLSATTYQLQFTPEGPLPTSLRHLHPSYFVVPVASIRKIERAGPRGRDAGPVFVLDISCKDVRVLSIGFRDELTCEKVGSHLRMVAFPHKMELLHAFSQGSAAAPPAHQGPSSSSGGGAPAAAGKATMQAGWDFYNPYKDLERLGVLALTHPRTSEPLWRISDINREYAFCPTYPAVLVFPERVTDLQLMAVGHFRSKARVPAMTWMHPVNKTTLWRCSQPRVGMSNNSCREDEAMFAAIREANLFSRDPAAPLLIADCRPKANAMAQKAGGWGYESYSFCQLEFLGIHNIHAVRDSYKKLEAMALSASPSDVNWTQQLADSGWLYHVRSVLSGALFVTECMHRRGQSTVVHCSDGWDRTAQVCGLVQLLLDPFYRTLKGFCSLIAKEWCSFGHKFQERLGHASDKHEDTDISPVFLQWLDAVAQVMQQFPEAFEFSPRALLFIAHHLHTCRFGTFLYNCERERLLANLHIKTPSLWGYLTSPAVAPQVRNGSYNPLLGDVILPHPAACLRSVELWDAWFLRWSPFPSQLSSCNRLERYSAAAFDRSRVQEAMMAPLPAGSQGRAAAAGGAGAAAAGAGAASSAGTGLSASSSSAAFSSSVEAGEASEAAEGQGHSMSAATKEQKAAALNVLLAPAEDAEGGKGGGLFGEGKPEGAELRKEKTASKLPSTTPTAAAATAPVVTPLVALDVDPLTGMPLGAVAVTPVSSAAAAATAPSKAATPASTAPATPAVEEAESAPAPAAAPAAAEEAAAPAAAAAVAATASVADDDDDDRNNTEDSEKAEAAVEATGTTAEEGQTAAGEETGSAAAAAAEGSSSSSSGAAEGDDNAVSFLPQDDAGDDKETNSDAGSGPSGRASPSLVEALSHSAAASKSDKDGEEEGDAEKDEAEQEAATATKPTGAAPAASLDDSNFAESLFAGAFYKDE